MVPFGGFRVSCDSSVAERSPGHSVGANGRRGREGFKDSIREGILIPRESGKFCLICNFFFQWRRTTRLVLLIKQSLEMEVLEKRCRQRRPER